MKKFIKYTLLLIFVLLMFMAKETKASTGSTVFIGEPVVLDSYENVEITYNDVEINEETSEIKNTHLFTNLSAQTITRKASIKLEDSFSNFTINSLKIVVNGYEIKEITKEGDNYTFSFQILPNEGKKIEISYKTDNDLQNAKIIKYSLDKLKGKYIGKFSINILFQEADIPLVEKIYPSCYQFNYTNNTMNTTYYSFTVNNLTTNFIVQKETYKNLIYGMGEELSEKDIYILKNAKAWIKEGIDFDYTDIGNKGEYWYIKDLEEQITKNMKITETQNEDSHSSKSVNMIKQYIVYKQLKKDGKIQYYNELLKDDYDPDSPMIFVGIFAGMDGYNPLVFEYFLDYILDKDLDKYYGYKVCIDYVKSEGDKELYVHKNTTGSEEPGETDYKYSKTDEFSILRTKNNVWIPDRIGAREIIINEDIDGNEIEATEEEKIAYVNMLNADLYIREVIYDGNTEIEEYGRKTISKN